MDLLLLAGRLLLAALLGVAAVAKFADLPGSRQAMLGFGVPTRFAPTFGLLLPIAELVVALLLILRPFAWLGALAALVLLVGFIAAIGSNLARGRTPECHCFGQLHSEPIGWQTLARNILLALVALWIVWQGSERVASSGANALAGSSGMTWLALAVGVVALVLAVLEGWFLINLLQQNGRLLLRIENLEAQVGGANSIPQIDTGVGLRVGSPAPAFSLAGLHGETLTLDSLRAAKKSLLLLFIDPQCGPCKELLPEVADWQRDYAANLVVVPITRGTAAANKAMENGLQYVLLQKDFEVAQSYQVTVTPSALLIRPDGAVGSSLAQGTEAIRTLVQDAATLADPMLPLPMMIPVSNRFANGNTQADADCGCGRKNSQRIENGNRAILPPLVNVGDVAPVFQLPDLSGNLQDFSSYKGHSTLILFWNPGCGYCRQMLNELQSWEANPPSDAPRLLFVSTGTVQENEAMKLRSPILLDTDFTVARNFGAVGTPSAILVDAEGRIASEVAAGREAVMALARGKQSQMQLVAK